MTDQNPQPQAPDTEQLVKKSKNKARLERMYTIVNEVTVIGSFHQTYIQPLIDALKAIMEEKGVEHLKRRQVLMAQLRELALDEGMNPDFLGIQIDTDTMEIRYSVRKEKKETPWPDKEEKKPTPKKPTAKKKATRKKVARSP